MTNSVGKRGGVAKEAMRRQIPLYLFNSKSEACVDILSTVYFTIGAFLDELRENVLPPLFVLGVHWLDFLIEQEWGLRFQNRLDPKSRAEGKENTPHCKK